MAAPFKLALRHYPRFLANSSDTRRKLAAHCRSDAEVTLYRPPVRNVFGLQSKARAARDAEPQPLRLVALGTVEPRKNFCAAATIVSALRARGFPDATLDIVGRQGWGDDWRTLETIPGVTLHGYQPAEHVKQLLDDADLFICTSHDEGLGLPLLEAQYAGLPIIAPDASIFREVLGDSGIFIDPTEPVAAAARIAATLSDAGWRARHVALAQAESGALERAGRERSRCGHTPDRRHRRPRVTGRLARDDDRVVNAGAATSEPRSVTVRAASPRSTANPGNIFLATCHDRHKASGWVADCRGLRRGRSALLGLFQGPARRALHGRPHLALQPVRRSVLRRLRFCHRPPISRTGSATPRRRALPLAPYRADLPAASGDARLLCGHRAGAPFRCRQDRQPGTLPLFRPARATPAAACLRRRTPDVQLPELVAVSRNVLLRTFPDRLPCSQHGARR